MPISLRLEYGGIFMSRELQTLNQQNKLALWAERISACQDSGQGVKAWCREHDICEGTFYKWQKKLFEMSRVRQQASFVEVAPLVHSSKSVAVTVRIAGAEADIHSGADSETVRMVLQIMKSC